jgi:hypothetical protein
MYSPVLSVRLLNYQFVEFHKTDNDYENDDEYNYDFYFRYISVFETYNKIF